MTVLICYDARSARPDSLTWTFDLQKNKFRELFSVMDLFEPLDIRFIRPNTPLQHMNILAIGNEKEFLEYCKDRDITPIIFPEELEFNDNKNKGYHFVYEKRLHGWVDIQDITEPAIILLGSGNHHYISHSILRKIIDKQHDGYTLILIDNHPDCEDINIKDPKGDYPINCATHVRETLRKGKLVEVIHIYRKELANADWYDTKLNKRTYKEATGEEQATIFNEQMIDTILANIFDEVYLSIDIDALSHDDVDIEQYQVYDQGQMRLDELLLILRKIKKLKQIIGIDICGMSEDKRAESVYDAIIEVLR